MDRDRADKLLRDMQKHAGQFYDMESQYEEPFFEAVGDDLEGMFEYLEGLSLDDLDWVSGMFCDIYEKWHDKKTKKRLDKMAKKLWDNGYSFSW